MLFSYNWLKKHVPDLPNPEKLEEGIIFHSFEVESLESKNNDWLMEVKVLPDRAHDCLCHFGLAREASTLFNLELLAPARGLGAEKINTNRTNKELQIKIDDPDLCRRYVGRRVEGVKIGPSPAWLIEALESVGQRSINNIVDATNYVLFDIGQPLHAFDADKVHGSITARRAKVGEKMITLDNRELSLDENDLVIVDELGPLALAGIKGGNRAEIDDNTKNIILESANFDPVAIRKTSSKFNLRTDASKRFENELSSETVLLAMNQLSALIAETSGGQFGEIVDNYPTKQEEREIIVSPKNINLSLGIEVEKEEIKNILSRLGIEVREEDERLKLKIPFWRLDLLEEANIVEEVGRIYGYEKIIPETKSQALRDLVSGINTVAEKNFALANKIRKDLASKGFVEVMGYALTDKGELELANPLSIDKKFLRTNLKDWLEDRIKFNLSYVLFDTDEVKIFEIGRVFVGGNEEVHVATGVGYKKPKLTIEIVEKKLGEFEVEENDGRLDIFADNDAHYQPVSIYPRIIRDIAVWVPADMEVKKVSNLIKQNAGVLCVDEPVLFDEFEKEGRKSLAFRLVFQSDAKTLSDDEVNVEMKKVEEALKAQSYEVR